VVRAAEVLDTPVRVQELWNARIVPSACRVTSSDLPTTSYTTVSPGSGSSSSRHAICHTRGHTRSASRSKNACEV
jgi:hypothetical protein